MSQLLLLLLPLRLLLRLSSCSLQTAHTLSSPHQYLLGHVMTHRGVPQQAALHLLADATRQMRQVSDQDWKQWEEVADGCQSQQESKALCDLRC